MNTPARMEEEGRLGQASLPDELAHLLQVRRQVLRRGGVRPFAGVEIDGQATAPHHSGFFAKLAARRPLALKASLEVQVTVLSQIPHLLGRLRQLGDVERVGPKILRSKLGP